MERNAVRFLGITDEVTTCDCCGRNGLKRTVGLSVDGDAPVYYGTTCAARALSMPAADVTREAKAADDARQAEQRKAREAEQAAATAVWFAFLDGRVPQLRGQAFRQIEALGGYTAARAAFTGGF